MAEGLRYHVGGIQSLLDLVDEFGEAIEYDLWQLPQPRRLEDLGADGLPWRDLRIILEHLPESSAFHRVRFGDDSKWDFPAQLMATQIDVLNMIVWLNSKDGQKGINRPRQIPRPGVVSTEQRVGADPLPIDEMAEWLGWSEN